MRNIRLKKSIPDYISSLAGDDFSILEDIFEYKYRKLLCFYWIICDYSDLVESVSYKDSKDNSKLDINLVIDASAKKIKDIKKEMEANVPEGWDISFVEGKGDISVHIEREEFDINSGDEY